MNEPSDSIRKLTLFFEHSPNLYVTLVEYGATHHRGRLWFTPQCAGDRVEIYFDDCFYICGNPSSGPYRFEIRSIDSEHGEYVILTGNADQFILKCGGIKIVRVTGPTCELFFN